MLSAAEINPQDINILICCEHTGALSDEFSKLGFNVTSCDFKEKTSPGTHYQGNVFDIVPGSFHALIGFPPCTYLAKAGLHYCISSPGRSDKRNSAVTFFKSLFDLPIPFIALENPTGYLNTHFKQPSQMVQPWYFGDPYKKEICLWTKNFPPLMSRAASPGRKHVANHVNGRMSQDLKSEIKSSWLYYPRMCKAIAEQWGRSILKDFSSNPVLRKMIN